MTFPIMFMDGSIQYIAFFSGYDIDKLWFLLATDKFHSHFITFWLFWFIFGISTIYFFFIICTNTRRNNFTRTASRISRDCFTWTSCRASETSPLGFIHFTTPDSREMIHLKICSLLLWSWSFWSETCLRCKTLQWIMVWMTGMRMVIMMMFSHDIMISNGGKEYSVILSGIYESLFILYILLWVMPMIHELLFLSHTLWRK